MAAIDIGGAHLGYDLSGRGADLIVLLHEIGGSRESWREVADILSARMRVLRYDQRGAGESSRITGDFNIETQADDLGRLLDALALDACHVAGVAIGAAIAVRFSASHPKRVRSLVLACPALNVDPARKEYLDRRAAAVERDGMAAVVDGSLANSYPPQVIRDRAAFESYRARFLANDPKSYAAINRAFVRFDAAPDLSRLSCPTLVLAGIHDTLRTPTAVRSIAARIANAGYREVDSGHIMPVQAPQALAAEIRAFHDEIAMSAAVKSP